MISYGNRVGAGAPSKAAQPTAKKRRDPKAKPTRRRPKGGWPLEVDGLAWENAKLAAEYYGIALSTLRGAVSRGGGMCQGHRVRRLESLAEYCNRKNDDDI